MCGRPTPKACPKAAPVRGAPNVPRLSAMRRPTSGRNAETSPSELPSRGISASQPLAVLVSLTLAIEASEAITRCSSLQYNVAPFQLAGGVAVVALLRLCLWYFRFVSRIVVSSSCMWSSGHVAVIKTDMSAKCPRCVREQVDTASSHGPLRRPLLEHRGQAAGGDATLVDGLVVAVAVAADEALAAE